MGFFPFLRFEIFVVCWLHATHLLFISFNFKPHSLPQEKKSISSLYPTYLVFVLSLLDRNGRELIKQLNISNKKQSRKNGIQSSSYHRRKRFEIIDKYKINKATHERGRGNKGRGGGLANRGERGDSQIGINSDDDEEEKGSEIENKGEEEEEEEEDVIDSSGSEEDSLASDMLFSDDDDDIDAENDNNNDEEEDDDDQEGKAEQEWKKNIIFDKRRRSNSTFISKRSKYESIQ